MFPSKSVWYLPFAILTVTFLLYGSIGIWFSQWMVGGSNIRPLNALDAILSPETVDALYEDARVHDTLLSLTESVAKASLNYGNEYHLNGLKSLGMNLTERLQRIRVTHVPTRKAKRQGLISGLLPGGNEEGLLGGILSGAGNTSGGLGDLFGQALSGLGGDLAGCLATPAYFLGIGLGMGVETGLNLTDQNNVNAIATQAASAMGMEPTGLNLVAQNLGTGLSAQLAPALGNADTDLPIGMAAFALAQGIGQGSANGLGLTQEAFQPNNGSDYMTIARNIGLGISGPIARNLNTQQLFNQSGFGGGVVMDQLPQIAMAAGHGLGEGASKGLGLKTPVNMTSSFSRKRQAPADPNQLDIAGAVGNFTSGLSESFLQSADLSKILDPSSLNLMPDAAGILSYASGAGKGLGEGVAIGLKLATASDGAVTSPETGSTGINATQERIAEQLVKGVVAGFLQNGGTSAAGKAFNSGAGGFMKNIVPAKAAEGAARGLVEGAINGLSQAGGLQNVLSGNFSMDLPMKLASLPPTAFDDTVNGSAVSFMRGLSGEGLLLFAQYMNAGKNGSAPPVSKRSVDAKGVVLHNQLPRRQITANPSLAIDGATIQGIAQSGIGALTCSGVGGIAAVALGIMDSPTLKINMMGMNPDSSSLDSSTLAALPTDPFTVTSEGNTFYINLAQGTFRINGLPLVPFGIMTGLHILFTTLAFFFVLPIYLVMGAVMRISIMINVPFNAAKNKTWRIILLLYMFTPLALGGIILGFVAMGNSRHLHTAHGIIGLIVLVITIPTVIVTFFRLRTSTPEPPPSAFHGVKQIPALLKGPQKVYIYSGILVQITLGVGTVCWIEGWSDLRSISLCVVDAVLTANTMVKATNLLVFLQVSAMAIFGLRQYLEMRIAKLEAKAAKEGDSEVHYTGEKGAGVRGAKRTDTMKTFGFDNTPTPPLPTRQTTEFLGREDSQIGWPSQVRRIGEGDPPLPHASPPKPFENITLFPSDPRTYNPKLGGFEEDLSPMFPPPPTMPVQLASRRPSSAYEHYRASSGSLVRLASQPPSAYGHFRASSEIDPKGFPYAVAMQPQPPDAGGREKNTRGEVMRKESFSRPFDTIKRPTEEDEWFGMAKGEEKWLKEFGAFRRF